VCGVDARRRIARAPSCAAMDQAEVQV
jgi:hypothetical protein